MSEIKQLNLTQVAHNPLHGQAATGNLSDNIRRAAEARMAEQMNRYKVTAMKRAENDYQIGKRTENFVFSNYPSGKNATWDKGLGGLKFGEGSRSDHLARWKEQVGGNMQGFEQYYQAGKQAEMDGIKKSLIRDPLKYSEKGWKRHISKTIAGWEPEKRQSFFNSLDMETRGQIMQYYDPDSQLSWSEWGSRMWEDKPITTTLAGLTGLGVTAGASVAILRALKKGDVPKAQKLAKGAGLDKKQIQKLLGPGGGSGGGGLGINTSKMSKSEILKLNAFHNTSVSPKDLREKRAYLNKLMQSGKISGKDAKSLWNRKDSVELGLPFKNEAGKSVTGKELMVIANDKLSPQQLREIPRYVKESIKGGVLTQSQGDQLLGVIRTAEKSGKPITALSIHQAINSLGPKGTGLSTALTKVKNTGVPGLSWLSKLKNIAPTALGYAGAGYAASGLTSNFLDSVGMDEEQAEKWGTLSGAVAAPVAGYSMPAVQKKLKDVIAKKGSSYVIRQLATKLGWKKAAQIVGKGLITGVGGTLTAPTGGWGFGLGAAWMAYDLYSIADALSEIE